MQDRLQLTPVEAAQYPARMILAAHSGVGKMLMARVGFNPDPTQPAAVEFQVALYGNYLIRTPSLAEAVGVYNTLNTPDAQPGEDDPE